ncbi:hypothetical protein DES40_0013 [Litorimonas taeanensis]|uniref:Uncharacterized protein n=1 Tax=Litorimonas taeanensis TaxID=568099 RepID=A0A420WIH6_9PROT|nr:hypothetical protein [Litorimonas taeanensis]RKQ70715.1 hypothetical protein DES40_0013 [Litorimonas taeanensis]
MFLPVLFSMGLSQQAHAERLTKLTVPVSGYGDVNIEPVSIQPGDVIFEQKIVPTENIILSENSDIFVRKTGNTKITFTSGMRLYLVEDKKGQKAFCSLEPTFLATPKIGKPIKLQSCLMDSDKDGQFDRVFTSEKGQLDLPNILQNILIEQKKPFDPIRYERSDLDGSINALSRLIYKHKKKDKLVFEFQIQSVKGEWLRLGRVEKVIAGDSQDLVVFGSRLKLTSLQDEKISIEVLSGLDKAKSFALSMKMIASKKDIDFKARE